MQPDVATFGALEPVLRRELARRRLIDFARYVYPGFETPPHIEHIANLLEKVERGELRRLAIAVPVRHGKSVLASQVFTSWYLGRHPKQDVVLASHSEDLAVRNSRVAKGLVEDDRWPFDARLSRDSTSAQRWNLDAGGGCYAVGVGGGVTGRGANLLLIDDALHDGLSAAERENAFRWYSEIAVPRLEPGGAIVLIGARFAQDDLLGRILDSEDGPNWTVVRLPALAEEEDPLGRREGTALWPARMDVAEIEMRRVSMGSRAFSAQFQQQPIPLEGALFKREWLSHRYSQLPDDRPRANPIYANLVETPRRNLVIQAIDTALGLSAGADYTVIATLLSDHRDVYLVNIRRERVEFPALQRLVIEEFYKYEPAGVYIEQVAAHSGTALVQELRKNTNLPIVGVPPKGDKVSRAELVTPYFEAGRVKLPERAPWLDAFLDEMCSFPNGSHRIHDDQVDAVVLGLSRLMKPQTAVDFHRRGSFSDWTGWMAT